MPSDKDYQLTKNIKQGKARINQEFQELAGWIDRKYGVNTLNVIYDEEGGMPRLQICLEFESDKAKFYITDKNVFKFDEVKQAEIVVFLKQSLIIQGLLEEKSFLFFFKKRFLKFNLDNVYVYFTAFENIAKQEANGNVSQAQIVKLENEIHNKDLWKIVNGFVMPIFFLHTEEQVAKHQNTEFRVFCSNRFYELLAPFDEFNYYKKYEYIISFDSKENFENRYDGNWYYYFR